MLTYHQLEFLTNERQNTFLAEADARRLANSVAINRPSLLQHLRRWIGVYLIQWGRALQETKAPLPIKTQPQPAPQ